MKALVVHAVEDAPPPTISTCRGVPHVGRSASAVRVACSVDALVVGNVPIVAPLPSLPLLEEEEGRLVAWRTSSQSWWIGSVRARPRRS